MSEKTSNGSLDDSLTSIQWLCQLESNKLLGNASEKKESVASSPKQQLEVDNNPYRKPQYSYATLIVLAINSARDKRMTLQEIYAWIEENFPFYQYAKKGWKNSIRHNLSLHKFFIKEQRTDVLCGKGSYWRISPEGKENLMRDLLKPTIHNLQPPIALLPHDPNRKLRPIMPKPSSNENRRQFVPLVNCNLPIVLVPSTNTSSTQIAQVVSESSKNNYVNSDEQNVMSTSAQPVTQSKTIQNPNPLISKTEIVDKSRGCQSGSESHNRQFSKATPTKTSSCVPTNRRSNRKTASRSPKDTLKKREHSKVSKNPKRVPNILRRKKSVTVPKSPNTPKAKFQTPLKNSVNSTLAAINSSNRTPCSPKGNYDDLINMFNTTSPSAHNKSFDILQHCFGSPGISPFRSPVCFNSGLTPLGYGESESGVLITPSKPLGDLSFNLTPVLNQVLRDNSQTTSTTTQRCRKSLGLDKVNEETECIESSSCW